MNLNNFKFLFQRNSKTLTRMFLGRSETVLRLQKSVLKMMFWGHPQDILISREYMNVLKMSQDIFGHIQNDPKTSCAVWACHYYARMCSVQHATVTFVCRIILSKEEGRVIMIISKKRCRKYLRILMCIC